MNIIEVVKRGKRFRRKGWDSWLEEHEISQMIRADILADDWEVESPPVTITREQFDAAWSEAVQKAGGRNLTYGNYECFSDLVAEELGL